MDIQKKSNGEILVKYTYGDWLKTDEGYWNQDDRFYLSRHEYVCQQELEKRGYKIENVEFEIDPIEDQKIKDHQWDAINKAAKTFKASLVAEFHKKIEGWRKIGFKRNEIIVCVKKEILFVRKKLLDPSYQRPEDVNEHTERLDQYLPEDLYRSDWEVWEKINDLAISEFPNITASWCDPDSSGARYIGYRLYKDKLETCLKSLVTIKNKGSRKLGKEDTVQIDLKPYLKYFKDIKPEVVDSRGRYIGGKRKKYIVRAWLDTLIRQCQIENELIESIEDKARVLNTNLPELNISVSSLKKVPKNYHVYEKEFKSIIPKR
ncbi:MAG: hypothetical protein KDC80_00635 [Saprospiraceae bacterium]|nr:hypothetical protein [Saprospiraceae bacterium]